jgi:hypothetical protein
MAYIYSITNLVNNKIYIGLTTKSNPYDRWKQHLYLAKNKDNLSESNSAYTMPIIRAISKYGADKFKFRVVEECDDNIVNKREKYWIEKFDTCSNKGYNATLGGEGVNKPRKYWSNHPNSKPISCFTLEGEWVKDYDTAGVAADCLGNKKGKTSISACIKGITFQALGYRWAYKGETPKLIEKRVNRRGEIYGIHLKSDRKKMWKCAADFAEEIIGNRRSNNGIVQSLNSPNNNKLQVYDWYLFRNKNDALSDWTPAKRANYSSDYFSKLGKLSAKKKSVAVKGVNVNTGEVVEFNSICEASYFIKGEGDRSAVPNIHKNIKRLENGQRWCYAFGYRWYKNYS